MNELQSFLRVATNRSSSVFQGTLYELTVKCVLQRQGMELVRSGQAGDNGVDLHGVWPRPAASKLNVLVQCKSSQAKTPARLLRELEGTYNYNVDAARRKRTVIMYASPQPLTSHGLAFFDQAETPLVYWLISRFEPVYDPSTDSYDESSIENGSLVKGVLTNGAAKKILGRLVDSLRDSTENGTHETKTQETKTQETKTQEIKTASIEQNA